MTKDKDALLPGEEIIWRGRPLWRSFWVFLFGVALCVVGPLTRPDGPMGLTTGLVFAGVFAIIILRRWTNVYTLTNLRLLLREGLIERDTSEITLADVRQVERHQGMTLRLVGAGHLFVRSHVPEQENILIYGQPDPDGFKTRLERLAEEARARRTGKPGA